MYATLLIFSELPIPNHEYQKDQRTKEMTRPAGELQVPFRTWVYSGAYVHMGSSSLVSLHN
jgi:hypothetical protein